MSPNEYTAADAQRDFADAVRNPATPRPDAPMKITVPHPAKPMVSISVTAEDHRAQRKQDAEIVRRNGGPSPEEYEKGRAELDAEEEARWDNVQRGDFAPVTVHTEDGTRTMNQKELGEFAAKRFAALFD